MSNHSDSIHCTFPEFVILLGKVNVIIFELADGVLHATNPVKVSFNGFFYLCLKLFSAIVMELAHCNHLSAVLVLNTERKSQLLSLHLALDQEIPLAS